MGRLKPHHSCLRDDSQVWQPAGLENSVGGLKTKSSRLQNDPMVWHTTGWRAHWDVRKPHHFIHYLPITQTKPYYNDIEYPILHHILFKLYCWLNGSVVFGQKGTFVSIDKNLLQTKDTKT